MGYLEFCSNCGEKNRFGDKDGGLRYYCNTCDTIHYENPKPTATLVCTNNDKILLVKRAFEPARGHWCLPGGFIEKEETAQEAAHRELKEETNLEGKIVKTLGVCSQNNTMFGDVLLIGFEMKITCYKKICAGDDASDAKFFNVKELPSLAFSCHKTILNLYFNQ